MYLLCPPSLCRIADTFRPFSLLTVTATTLLVTLFAIAVDTEHYQPTKPLLTTLFNNPVCTPLNSLLYNSQSSNLALHGLHPHYQHLIANLPQLLGPALVLIFVRPERLTSLPLLSALSGILFLSIIPHQEARFLLPAVPLILCSLHLPASRTLTRYWLTAWIIFNAIFGVLMGTYHQGGVVPVQAWLGEQPNLSNAVSEVLWWRTYSPPIWLLDHNPSRTTDLMGTPFSLLQHRVDLALAEEQGSNKSVGLVAPWSSLEFADDSWKERGMVLEEMWRWDKHLNLDDLDIGEEGVWGTLRRVVGRRGLVVWRVSRGREESRGRGIVGGIGR